jgi:hypothetical protein
MKTTRMIRPYKNNQNDAKSKEKSRDPKGQDASKQRRSVMAAPHHIVETTTASGAARAADAVGQAGGRLCLELSVAGRMRNQRHNLDLWVQ